MLGMTPAKQGNWETVGKAKEEKKKRDAEKPRADATPTTNGGGRGKGAAANGNGAGQYTNSVFAEFDRAFAQSNREKEQQQRAAANAAAAAAALAATQTKVTLGKFAHLAEKETPGRRAARDSDDSDGDDGPAPASSSASAAAGGKGDKAKPAKAKAPKKPRVGVAQVAAGVDAAALQEVIAGLQQRYAGNEASQVEVLADSVAKMFKEAQVDLPKALATKPLARCVGIPLEELPPQLANALASFCASVGDAALAEVGVALLAALSESLPLDPAAPQHHQQQPQKQSAGLLIMLATMLRARPGALVLAAPQLLALGRALTAPGRLPLLLWALSQAAEAEPAAAAAAWVRVLLPQCVGAPLPVPVPKSGAPAAPAAVPRLDASSLEAAVAFFEGLLQRLGPGAADVALGGGQQAPVVPGAAVEALARAAAPPAPDAVAPAAGGKGGKGGAAGGAAAAEALAARLHARLVALAGASRAGGPQQGEWLVLALETAGLSSAAPDAPDALTDRAAASVAALLASPSGEGAYDVWESKHKGQLRGSSRVLGVLARKPDLLRSVLANRQRAEALRRLLAALPARHRAHLAAGKGWQAAAAKSAEASVAALRRRAAGGWGGAFGGGAKGGGKGKASAAGAGHGAAAAGVLALAVAGGGVLLVASTYRREVAGVVSNYAGRPAAEALDASLLAPLNLALGPARAALAPHLAKAADALAPHVAAAADALAPHLAKATEALAPLAEQAGEAWRQLAAQAQDIYTRATQQ